MRILGVIPARYQSTRFPGKPLAMICGKPMLQMVYENAVASRYFNRVLIATDDKRIFREATRFCKDAVMTSKDHPSGTARIAQAVIGIDFDIVVNIQGDEPTMTASVIDMVIEKLLATPEADICTGCYPITDPQDFQDPNTVKVVFDKAGYALYFSRAPIPYPRNQEAFRAFAHIGLYAYRREALYRFLSWKDSTLAAAESLEQLAVLENGEKILVAQVEPQQPIIGVDTPEDLERVIDFIKTRKEL